MNLLGAAGVPSASPVRSASSTRTRLRPHSCGACMMPTPASVIGVLLVTAALSGCSGPSAANKTPPTSRSSQARR